MLAYLSRYTHRVAISNRRLIAFDENGVTFRYKDYRRDNPERQQVMTLAADEFRRGDHQVRSHLYEAATVILTRSSAESTLRDWGLKLRERIGFKRAAVAVARKLAVIMHAMLKSGRSVRSLCRSHCLSAPGQASDRFRPCRDVG